MEELLLKEEVYQVIGAAIEVHRELGHGFLEAVYQEALEIEFHKQSIPFESQKPLKIHYKGNVLNKRYCADLVCFGKTSCRIESSQTTLGRG